MFRGIPVREARASIHVQPNAKDIAGATQESPENCAYARCLKRTMECANVFVFKTICYIQTLDESGKPIMERFLVKSYARRYIVRFDHGEAVEPGGFVFHRPYRSITLNYKTKWRNTWKQGKSPRLTKTGPRKPKSEFELRSGKGRVHLMCKEDQIRPLKALNET
jgi:hypothetical protein